MFECSDFIPLTEAFPSSYVISVNGIQQLYTTGENAFWSTENRSDFHKQVLALMYQANWLIVKDSLDVLGEIIFTHPDSDKYGFIGIDFKYPDLVFLREEGDETKLLSVVREYIESLDEED
jgi:hypothetical protein